MSEFQIHAQLLTDCHRLGRMSACHVLLHRNAALPWFILVPETPALDLLDLDPEARSEIIADCAAISGYIKATLGLTKVNFAAIGNLVPQLHLHVVGRAPDDPCWPTPVWGNLPPGPGYPPERLSTICIDLSRRCGLRISETE